MHEGVKSFISDLLGIVLLVLCVLVFFVRGFLGA